MQFPKILFYEEGYREPLDYRSVSRLLQAFPRRYTEVVEITVKNSESLNEKAFRFNVALLMPSFGMTRRGAFEGIRLDKEGDIQDPDNVIGLCWKEIGDGLQHVRRYIDENAASQKRSRRLAELSIIQRGYVIRKTCKLFTGLCEIGVRRGQKRRARVGASKILFAALPEVALPVDNLEWDHVFKTDDYGDILTIMTDEIDEWERKTNKHLDDCDPHQPTTLPSIYNVLAMSIRPLERLPKSKILRQYYKYLKKSQQ